MCHVTEWRMEVGVLRAHYLASEVGILLNVTYKWPKKRMWQIRLRSI